MLNLNALFKSDIDSKTLNLVPLVRITKGETLYVSTNSIEFDGNYYNPVLLNIPSLKESVNFESRKYTISSVDLQLSNFPFEGDRLSDGDDLINAEVEIRWKSQSCEVWGDCLKVFIGKVRNIKTSSDNLTLSVEDVSQENLHRDLPVSMTDDSDQYADKDKNKPIPMVYGHVDASPCIKILTPDAESDDEFLVNRIIASDTPNLQFLETIKTLGDGLHIIDRPLLVRNNDSYLKLHKFNVVDLSNPLEGELNWEYYGEDRIDNTNAIGFDLLESVEDGDNDSSKNQGRIFIERKVSELKIKISDYWDSAQEKLSGTMDGNDEILDDDLDLSKFNDGNPNNFVKIGGTVKVSNELGGQNLGSMGWFELVLEYTNFEDVTFTDDDLLVFIGKILSEASSEHHPVYGIVDNWGGSRYYTWNAQDTNGTIPSPHPSEIEGGGAASENFFSGDSDHDSHYNPPSHNNDTGDGNFYGDALQLIHANANTPKILIGHSHLAWGGDTEIIEKSIRLFDATFYAEGILGDLISKDFYANVKGRWDETGAYTDYGLAFPTRRSGRTEETRMVNPMDSDTLIDELLLKNDNSTAVSLEAGHPDLEFPHPDSNIDGYEGDSTDAIAINFMLSRDPFIVKFRDSFCTFDDFISLHYVLGTSKMSGGLYRGIAIGELGEEGEQGKFWNKPSGTPSHMSANWDGDYYLYYITDNRRMYHIRAWTGDPNMYGGTNDQLFFQGDFEVVGNPSGIINAVGLSAGSISEAYQEEQWYVYDNLRITATSFSDNDDQDDAYIIGCADPDADNYGYDSDGNELEGDPQDWLNDQQVCVYENSPTLNFKAWISNVSHTHYFRLTVESDSANFYSTEGLEEFTLGGEVAPNENNETMIIIDFEGTHSAYGDDDNTSDEGESLVEFGSWDSNISFQAQDSVNMIFVNDTSIRAGCVIMLTDSENIGDNPRYGLLIRADEQYNTVSTITINVNVTDNSPGLNQTSGIINIAIDAHDPPPVLGCTDASACNYNADATEDDGSCTYPQEGYDCDGNPTNYGCQNSNATNYDPDANIGSDEDYCIFADTDGDGVPDYQEIPGCTDDTALNYNQYATDDDGSCVYAPDVELGEDADIEEFPLDQDVLIKNPADIIHHLVKEEIGVSREVNTIEAKAARDYHKFRFFNEGVDSPAAGGWNFGFTIDKKINSKKLIEEISKSTKLFPKFRNDGQFGFSFIKDLYSLAHIESQVGGSQDIKELIKNEDIISYKFSKTPLEQVCTRVKVLYKKDYADGDLKKDTDWLLVNDLFPDYQDVHRNYYGLDIEDYNNEDNTYKGGQELVFESEYIRHEETAKALRHFLLGWYKEQHNIVELKLPLSYIGLEIGDTITFNEMIEGIKLNGEDYSRNYVLHNRGTKPGEPALPWYVERNGQVIYPIWFITETRKNIDSVQIKAIQLHDWTASRPPVMGASGDTRVSGADFIIENIETHTYGGRGVLSNNIGKLGKTNFTLVPQNENSNASWDFVGNDLDYTINADEDGTAKVVFNSASGNYPYNVYVTMTVTTENGEQESSTKNIKLYRLGDINKDGNVGMKDIDLLNEILLGSNKFTKDTMFLADINEDGIVGASDLIDLRGELDVQV